MEQEMLKYFTSYGTLGILGFIFLRYIIKILDRQHEEYKKYHSELLETLVLLKDKIVHNYLDIDSIRILTRGRWRFFIAEIKAKAISILVNNNIKSNSDTIREELVNFGEHIISQTSEIFKPRMSEEDRKLIISLLRENIREITEDILQLIFEDIDLNYDDNQCFVYKTKIRRLKALCDKELNYVLEKIDELDI